MKKWNVIFLILIWLPSSAYAVLGERPSTAASNAKMVSKAAVSKTATVRVQTTTQDAGLTIKEFVDQTGFVYAVRWEGSHGPDLNALLGKYFPEYKLAAITTLRHMPRRRLSADSQNLHVTQFGHPGALIGLIYLKNQLPAGIQPEDLK